MPFMDNKDYKKFCKQWLSDNLTTVTAQKDDVVVKVESLEKFDGSASVKIVKNKAAYLFDIEVLLKYKAERTDKSKFTAADEKEIGGAILIKEFNPDDLEDEDEFSIQVNAFG